ncbi:MAG: V-type ATP synthase subunit I [Candidatus Methanomethylophilus sp.]|nr:V-type ATP synthase subunit I [Methanomethylophilus sp.]
MSRIVIVGTKTRLEDAVNALYCEKAIHVIDHTTGDDGLSIGTSLEKTSKASERLLKVRALEKELGINKHTKTADISVEDVQSRINAGDVEGVEDEVLKTVDARNDLTQKITELNSKQKILELLKNLNDITLDQYSGYKSIAVLAGTVTGDASSLKIDDAEIFSSYDKKTGGVAVVFVKKENRDQAYAALAGIGFVELHIPVYTTKVAAADEYQKIAAEIEAATAEIELCDKALEEMKERYKSFLKGSDEELSIAVEKGSVPLRIAVSEYSYIIDAWVPTKKVDSVKANLEQKLGDDVYVEFEETRGRNLEESEAQEPRFQNVPVKQNNGRIVCEYEYATSLVSVPKYQEIDPTFLIAIFLPLFFGFMVGDMGYAIPFIILGAYGLKKTKHPDWRAIALVLFFGGIWAFIFGLFFYGEMLGMHFVGGEYEAGVWEWHHDHVAVGGTSVTWDWIFGAKFPEWFNHMICSAGTWDSATGTWTGGETGIGKLVNVALLLKLSVYVGIVHLFIGILCGVYNIVKQHGGKAAFMEKGGLVFTFFGMILFCLALTQAMFGGEIGDIAKGTPLILLVVAIVCLVIGIALNAKAEGGMQAIMGIPEVIGWILSYTRLAAITMSKAGMALAFNYIVFGMIIATRTTAGGEVVFDPFANVIMLVVGIFLFCFLHLVVWTLGILSAGLHALRLQFVELMMRFYEGGGESFAPLQEVRTKTFFSKNTNNIKEV